MSQHGPQSEIFLIHSGLDFKLLKNSGKETNLIIKYVYYYYLAYSKNQKSREKMKLFPEYDNSLHIITQCNQ